MGMMSRVTFQERAAMTNKAPFLLPSHSGCISRCLDAWLCLMLPLQLWFLVFSSSAVAAQQCLSLADSTACPEFKGYYVSVGDPSFVAFPWLVNVTTVQAFDEGLRVYNTQTRLWLSLGCSSTLPPRYSLTMTCSQAVSGSTTSLPCNLEYNVLPRPVCGWTCHAYSESIKSMISTQRVSCSMPLNISFSHKLCQQTGGASFSAACIDGDINEEMCGFENDQTSLCHYCQNVDASLSCCQSAVCQSGLSVVDIFAICVGGVMLMGLVVYGYRHYKKNRGHRWREVYKMSFARREDALTANEESVTVPPIASEEDTEEDTEEEESRHALTSIRHVPSQSGLSHQGVSKVQTYMESFCHVIYTKEPQHEDEILITHGDILRIYYYFDDGWALGDNLMTGERGLFPLLCVMKMNPNDILALFSTAELTSPHSSPTLERDILERDILERDMDIPPHPFKPKNIPRLYRSLSIQSPPLNSIALPQRSASIASRLQGASLSKDTEDSESGASAYFLS